LSLFCLYFVFILTLLISLSQAGTGCHFGYFFVGALAYADDLVLFAPSLNATLCGLCCGYVTIMRFSLTLCLMPVNPNVCAASPAGAAKQVTPADILPSFSIGSRVIEFVDKIMASSGSYHNEGL